jgi:hypothetical protein
MRINIKVIGLGVTLCLVAGGAATLAEAAGQSSTVLTTTGTAVANPSPPPAVNGVPINPTTGALPEGQEGTTTTSQHGTSVAHPSPPPAVNGVPINPTTGALPQGKSVANYTGPDSRAIASGAAVRHQVRLTCFKPFVRHQHKKVQIVAPACR